MSSTPDIRIRTAQEEDRSQLTDLRAALWPESSAEELAATSLVTFIAESAGRTSGAKLVGFLEANLRSHADGCDPSHAVGFVEGWYVAEEFRNRGIGRRLLLAAEEWARKQGCIEMASDTGIENEASQRVHQALGFEVVDRCVHYRKTL